MGKPAGKRVLIVEDERELARLAALHLEDLGCEVDFAYDGSEGLAKALAGGFDLVLLDLMLPGIDGLEVCRRLRAQPDYVPILMLTARSTEDDRVLGLELGADDYLTKPFSLRELVARVKAIFRRMEAMAARDAPQDGPLRVGPVEIDPERRQVRIADRSVSLTAKEFDLLHELARHPGRVFTRGELLDRVWSYGYEGYEHTVNSHINRLRAKIEDDPAEPRLVQTVWGVGYRFFDPQDEMQDETQDDASC